MSSTVLDTAVDPDADGLVGGVTAWPSNALPSAKYRFCDGSTVSRTEFSLLFSRLGTLHGTGDGSTTFNLPNYQGRFLAGFNSADADFDTVGETGGTKTSSLPSHVHPQGGSVTGGPFVTAITQVEIAKEIPAGGSGGGFPLDYVTPSTATPGLSGDTGPAGSGPGTNCPPFTVVRYIIKVA